MRAWDTVSGFIGVVCAAVVIGSGCVPQEVDLEGRACPCGPGWSCVSEVCVEGEVDASAAVDLGEGDDGGARDLGGRDAGSDGGGPIDAGSDLGVDAPMPALCATASAIFCDDFERGLSDWSETTLGSGGTITVDSTRRLNGEQSLHAVSGEPAGRAGLIKAFAGVSTGTVYARSWLYVPSDSEHALITFMMLSEEVGGVYPLAAFQVTGGGLGRVYMGTPLDRYATGSAPYARDQWLCTTLEVDLNETTTTVRATIGGATAADETFDQRLFGEIEFLDVGLQYTGVTSPSAEIFMDDVEVGLEPLPCD